MKTETRAVVEQGFELAFMCEGLRGASALVGPFRRRGAVGEHPALPRAWVHSSCCVVGGSYLEGVSLAARDGSGTALCNAVRLEQLEREDT